MIRKLFIAAAFSLGFLALSAPRVEAQFRLPGFARPQRVEFRDNRGQERFFPNSFQARQFADWKRHQGFQVNVNRQRGHWRVRYRMNQWRVYGIVHDRHTARELQRHLQRMGFQARVR